MKTKKLLFTAIATIVLIAGAQAQNVNIPDANFKEYLLGNTAINTNGDNEIQVSEASVFNGYIFLPVFNFNLPGVFITDLTGIEAFVSLISLDCSFHALTSLNVSACTALTYLDCRESFWLSLTSLNVSGCTALINLDCSGNSLSSLDVSSCTALTNLYCYNNQLTSLNVKNGNNINMVSINDKGQQFYGFLASNNPNLSCIEVDNTAWSNSNWPYIDASASFSENCSGAGLSDINSNAPMFYPNPTTGNLFITEKAYITLTDLSGNLLLEEKNTNQLDISALPAGMYFLHFGENNNQIVKVIKE